MKHQQDDTNIPIKPQQFIHMIDTFSKNEKNDNRGIQEMIAGAIDELKGILETNHGAPTKVFLSEKADLSDRGSKVFEAFLLGLMTPVRTMLTLGETVVAPQKIKQTWSRFFKTIGAIPDALNVAVSGRMPKEYGSRTNAEIVEWIEELEKLNSSMQGLDNEEDKKNIIDGLVEDDDKKLSEAYEGKLNKAIRTAIDPDHETKETPYYDEGEPMTMAEAKKIVEQALAWGKLTKEDLEEIKLKVEAKDKAKADEEAKAKEEAASEEAVDTNRKTPPYKPGNVGKNLAAPEKDTAAAAELDQEEGTWLQRKTKTKGGLYYSLKGQ